MMGFGLGGSGVGGKVYGSVYHLLVDLAMEICPTKILSVVGSVHYLPQHEILSPYFIFQYYGSFLTMFLSTSNGWSAGHTNSGINGIPTESSQIVSALEQSDSRPKHVLLCHDTNGADMSSAK